VRVRHQADKCGRRVEPKTEQAKRSVPLPALLVAELREHRLATGRTDDDAPVFPDGRPGREGRPITPGMLSSAFGQAIKRAKLKRPGKRLSLHSLRHGYGSGLIADGRDIGQVSRTLGHANLSITLTIYTHEYGNRDAEQAQRMAASINARFGSQTGHSG
jgi:integrase